MTTYFISDPEGHDIMTNGFVLGEHDSLYILGDLTDSTVSPPLLPGNLPNFLQLKSFNLQNIMRVVKDERTHLIFGNRDLNKIRCIALNKLTNEDGDPYVAKYNDGSIGLSKKTYDVLKDIVSSKQSPWLAKMSNWYPFWSPVIKTLNEDIWRLKDDTIQTFPFFARYNDVFGLDNGSIGTMSAQNLLYTIPYELGIDVSQYLREPTEDQKKGDPKIHTAWQSAVDYYAFIVLAVYNSMLQVHVSDNLRMPDPQSRQPRQPSFQQSFTAEFCKGWLYRLLTSPRSDVCKMFQQPGKVLLCSHGGFTSNMLTAGEMSVESILAAIKSSNTESQLLRKVLTDVNELENKLGGYFGKTDDKMTFTVEQIADRVKTINDIFRFCILQSFAPEEIDPLPNPPMLFLQVMSTPFQCLQLQHRSPNINCTNLTRSEHISPINPGYVHARMFHFFVNGVTLYNIFGHLPVGSATTIDLFENGTGGLKSFLVNLDSSNSFRTNKDDAGGSYSHLRLDGQTLHIKSYINSKKFPVNVHTGELTWEKDQAVKPKKITLDMDLDLEFEERLKAVGSDQLVHFHGYEGNMNIVTIRAATGFEKVLVQVPYKTETQEGGSNDRCKWRQPAYERRLMELREKQHASKCVANCGMRGTSPRRSPQASSPRKAKTTQWGQTDSSRVIHQHARASNLAKHVRVMRRVASHGASLRASSPRASSPRASSPRASSPRASSPRASSLRSGGSSATNY
jgi:hypothetical protein